MKRLVLASSLPRSGSTLLSRIISQNPKIHSSPTSPLLDVLLNLKISWSSILEMRALQHTGMPDKTLPKVMKAIVETYYADTPDLVIDKCRNHNSYIDLWEHILGYKPKVIICVRDLPDIIASMEKLHRKTALVRQPLLEKEYYYQMQHIEGRAAVWTMPEQIIGLAYNRIVDAIHRHPECLHFVHFDKLTTAPEETMRKLYKFIGEDYFDHDFDNVPIENTENDDVNGYIDLHETRSKVKWFPSDARKILGDALTEKYNQYNIQILFPNLLS